MIGNITLDRELNLLLSGDVQFSNLIRMYMRQLAKRQARRGLHKVSVKLIEREVKQAVSRAVVRTNRSLAPYIDVQLTWDLNDNIVFNATLKLNDEFKSLKAQNTGSVTYIH